MKKYKRIGILIAILLACVLDMCHAEVLDYYVMPVVGTGVDKRPYEMSKSYDSVKTVLSEKTRRGKEDADYNDVNQPSYTKLDAEGNELPDDADSWTLVRDNVTGRIWEARSDDGSTHDKDNLYTYKEAEVYVNTLNRIRYGGYASWRIPNLKELSTIIDYGKYVPAIDTRYFPNQHSSFYWSSTECLDDSNFAWGVMFHKGEAYNHFKRIRFFLRAVCVDDGFNAQIKKYSDQSVRFKNNGDGTVNDYSTGLMWTKGYVVIGKGQNKQARFNLRDALKLSEESTYAGYSDWRLPTINELISIVDYSRRKPAIYSVFGTSIRDFCFFSSTVNRKNRCMYVVYFKNGDFNTLGIDNHIRFVRTIQTN